MHEGSVALVRYPKHAASICRVQKEGSFEIEDLFWICSTLNVAVRLILDPAVPNIDWLPRDFVVGPRAGQRVEARLWYSWASAVEESRRFGHYDILIPTECGVPSIRAPFDAPRLGSGALSVGLLWLRLVFVSALQ